MIIYRMRASFGKLHDTLELKPGMNYLCLPNEAGKSTWSAFLTAMLYGIDTSERASAANEGLPAKERYKPWDGSPMEGSVELEWKGRRITIQRTTERRIPMGVFRAYETDSGTPVPELTGENCGKMLCGVERSVFERTAFIRQQGMAVTGDGALDKRLEALVTTGEEGQSYSKLEAELKTLRNRLIGRGGKQADLTAQLDNLTEKLTQCDRLQAQIHTASEQKKAAEETMLGAELLLKRIDRAKEAQRWEGLTQLQEQTAGQKNLCDRLEQALSEIPTEPELRVLQKKLDSAEREVQTAQMEVALVQQHVEPPRIPACFEGLTPEEAKEQVRKDLEAYEAGTAEGGRLPLILAAVLGLLGAAGIGFGFFTQMKPLVFAGASLLLMSLILLAAGLSRKGKKAEQRRKERELLPLRYGVDSVEDLPKLAENYERDMLDYEARASELEGEQNAARDRLRSAQGHLAELIRLLPEQGNSELGFRDRLSAYLRAHERLTEEQRRLEQLTRQEAAMRTILGEEQAESDPEALAFDPEQVGREYEEAKETCYQCDVLLARLQGQLEACGDRTALEAGERALKEELSKVEEQTAAVELAMDALQKADRDLRSRFSPQITADAGKLLSLLTEGKYSSLLLNPDMKLSLREENGTVLRSAAAMSCGTEDQMYLALRLAMCARLLPEDAPLILDDALMSFDDQRAAQALKLLKKLGENRQIIFFTCHDWGEL